MGIVPYVYTCGYKRLITYYYYIYVPYYKLQVVLDIVKQKRLINAAA